jgi:hypothetical protein
MNYKSSTYVDPSQSRVQVGLKCFNAGAVLLGIHRGSNKPTNVEPNLDKVWVLCEGFSYQRGS